jgi:hypothetical protein
MPSFPLPLIEDCDLNICESADGLDVFLAPVNDPYIQARIGHEKLVSHFGNVVVTEGEKFRNRDGWTQGRRYLQLDPKTSQPVAALNISLRARGRKIEAVASNAFTETSHRRQGLAAGLLALAVADFPQMRADTALSAAGAALVGHAPGLDRLPSRKPLLLKY